MYPCLPFRLLVAVVGYIVVGMLVMRFYRGAQGLEMIPNFSFWKDFPFLLKVNFTVYTPRISYSIGGGTGGARGPWPPLITKVGPRVSM